MWLEIFFFFFFNITQSELVEQNTSKQYFRIFFKGVGGGGKILKFMSST